MKRVNVLKIFLNDFEFFLSLNSNHVESDVFSGNSSIPFFVPGFKNLQSVLHDYSKAKLQERHVF